MKSQIFVVMHKKCIIPKNDLYLPIVVGKKDFSFPKNYERDDKGKNIAFKNHSFCELTALYYIWQNKKDLDVYGLCHYRRYLMKKKSLSFADLLTEKDIINDLKEYDIILPKKRHFFKTNVKTQYYKNAHAYLKDYEILGDVIKKLYPSYYEAFKEVSNSHSTYLYNVFIMKKDLFDKYCTFIFNSLFEVEKRIDITNYSKEEQRIFGYLSERLMSVFVKYNNLKVKEYDILNIENDLKKEKRIILKNNIKQKINKLRGEK